MAKAQTVVEKNYTDAMVARMEEVYSANPTRATAEALAEHLERLEALDVEKVWVSHKMPLLMFLFPAVLPLVLFGDPTTLLLAWLN